LITKENIEELAKKHLENTALYLTGIKISPTNAVSVSIDGDDGVKISDCVALSRFIESSLDRDAEDFSLDVSSHGAASPLVLPRQYKKHLGREFEVKTLDGTKADGKLIQFNDAGIVLEFSTRENKPLGKGKITVIKQQTITYNQIKESKIKLKF
jgi:ribosome maturation factor RimP